MTTTPQVDELLALAARCEAATGPSRVLDAAIWALQPDYAYAISRAGGLWPKGCDRAAYERITAQRMAPAFSASLDAAISLAPEGWVWRHEPSKHVPHLASVAPRYSHGGYSGHSDHTAALALCAAALRAIANNTDGMQP